MTKKSARRKRRPKIPVKVQREVRSIHYDEGKKAVLCAWCGVAEDRSIGKLTFHHIDGDSNNNSIENIIPLCDYNYKNNCHLRKGHNGNTKKINNNLLKEINMKDYNELAKIAANVVHEANKEHRLYTHDADNPKRCRAILRGKGIDGQFVAISLMSEDDNGVSKPFVVDGEEYEDTQFALDVFEQMTTSDEYTYFMDLLDKLHKNDPVKDFNGDPIGNFYRYNKDDGSESKKRRYYKVFRDYFNKKSNGDTKKNTNTNTSLVVNSIPVALTGSVLGALAAAGEDRTWDGAAARVLIELFQQYNEHELQ
jgi:hypothetical protein